MIFESSLHCTIIGMGQDSFWDLDTRLKFTLFPQYEKLIKPGEGDGPLFRAEDVS